MNLAQLALSENLSLPRHRHLADLRNRDLLTMGHSRVVTNSFEQISGALVQLQPLVRDHE